MKPIFLACVLGFAVSLVASDRAGAQGASGDARVRPTGQPSSAGATSSSSQTGAQGDASIDETGGLDIGSYGELQGNFSQPLGDTIFLRLDGAVDLEEQTGSRTDGDVRGSVGLGWKY